MLLETAETTNAQILSSLHLVLKHGRELDYKFFHLHCPRGRVKKCDFKEQSFSMYCR